jgi:hypothetical protein
MRDAPNDFANKTAQQKKELALGSMRSERAHDQLQTDGVAPLRSTRYRTSCRNLDLT